MFDLLRCIVWLLLIDLIQGQWNIYNLFRWRARVLVPIKCRRPKAGETLLPAFHLTLFTSLGLLRVQSQLRVLDLALWFLAFSGWGLTICNRLCENVGANFARKAWKGQHVEPIQRDPYKGGGNNCITISPVLRIRPTTHAWFETWTHHHVSARI